MTTTPTKPPAPQQTEAQEYLDMVYDSWQSVGYIQRQGRAMLVKNLGLTDEQAQAAIQAWIKSKEKKG